MKVIVADTAGFCKGVKSALEVTLEAIQNRKNGERICTFGPLIHNRHVMEMLEKRGVQAESTIEGCAGRKVVVRAHGIPPEQRRALRQAGAVILDATCKRVARVQAVIKRFARQGYRTIIVGDADHAEVIGLMGYTEGKGTVINRPEQIGELPGNGDKVLLVAQTTQNEEVFHEVSERFLERFSNGVVKNTICGSTHERQTEVRNLCRQVDAMIIVGGRNSGNTQRLAETARECGVPAYHIETEADLDPGEMRRFSCVGVSAGASTPNWMIRNVVNFLESINRDDTHGLPRWGKLLELLTYSNAFVALEAAFLTSVVTAITGLHDSFPRSVVAAFYVFAVHTLNRYLDRHAIQLNNPKRAAYYQRWQFAFTGISIAAVVAALWIAQKESLAQFFALLALVLFGVLYGVPLFRTTWRQGLSTLKIKDIPASKTFLIPVAWATVTAILPHLGSFFDAFGTILYAFWIVFLLVLIRTALLDLLDVQGDLLVGKETIVVHLGEANTHHFIVGVLVILGFSLLLGPLAGVGSNFSYILLPTIFGYTWCISLCSKGRLKGCILPETVIESIPIAAGLVSLIWIALFD